MKKTGIKDVARVAKVSVTTVSKALNNYPDISEKTRQKIKDIAYEMDYVPDADARRLAGKTDTTIAFILSELMTEDASGIVFKVMSGVYHACKDNKCDFILLATTPEEQKTTPLSSLCSKRSINGVVAFGFKTDDPYITQFKQLNVPVAVVDLEIEHKNIISVTVNNLEASKQAVTFLMKKGHKNIGLINGRRTADVSTQRYAGYAVAHEIAGIPVRNAYISYCDFSEDKAFDATIDMLHEHPELTAFFCASDIMAIGVCNAILSLGKIPGKDIDVFGFDDIPISKYIFGGISTIKQYHYQHGYEAGRNLINKINGKPYESISKMDFTLEIRNTAKNLCNLATN